MQIPPLLRQQLRQKIKQHATQHSTTPAQDKPLVADAEKSDDAALFEAAIGTVRRISAAPAPPAAPKPKAQAKMRLQDDTDALSEFQRAMHVDNLLIDDALCFKQPHVPNKLLIDDALCFKQPHVPNKLLNDLRRGRYAAQDELDLHGYRSQQAEALLRDFLAHARTHGHGCVRVIHGKGLRADSGVPVIKNLVDRLLRQRSEVLAFASAPQQLGGTGAVLVLLKRA